MSSEQIGMRDRVALAQCDAECFSFGDADGLIHRQVGPLDFLRAFESSFARICGTNTLTVIPQDRNQARLLDRLFQHFKVARESTPFGIRKSKAAAAETLLQQSSLFF
jgi:hypothetical protein